MSDTSDRSAVQREPNVRQRPSGAVLVAAGLLAAGLAIPGVAVALGCNSINVRPLSPGDWGLGRREIQEVGCGPAGATSTHAAWVYRIGVADVEVWR